MAQQRRRNGTGSAKKSTAKSTAKSSSTTSQASSRKSRAKNRAAKSPTRGTAPSAPDIRSLQLLEPSDEAKAHEASDVDAMGQNKRREVIGHAYGPSKKSQLLVLGGVIGAFVLFFGGGKLAADKADEQPKTNPDAAPWSQAGAPQIPAQRPQ